MSAAFAIKDACAYLGGISRTTLWRKTRAAGVAPNIFGTYNREDLDRLRQAKSRTVTQPPGSTQ